MQKNTNRLKKRNSQFLEKYFYVFQNDDVNESRIFQKQSIVKLYKILDSGSSKKCAVFLIFDFII